jgi:hypothetical protein
MATGNLIFHTGTDWTGGSYDWPIAPIPTTIKVHAWRDGPASHKNGYFMWASVSTKWSPTTTGEEWGLPPIMSIDTNETRYNMWALYLSDVGSFGQGSSVIAVIEDGGAWSVWFIYIHIAGDSSDYAWVDSNWRSIVYKWHTGIVGGGASQYGYMAQKWTSSTNAANGPYTLSGWWHNASWMPQFEIQECRVTADPSALAESENKLVFTTQPSASTVAGSEFAQQPVVEIRDLYDDLIDTATDEVTLSLSDGDWMLTGTATVAAVAGVATFAGLGVNGTGLGMMLTATAYGAEPETSATFDITPAFQLVFTTQPSASTVAGSEFAQQPVVEIRDMDNVLIDTATDDVTLYLTGGPGTLTGTVTVAAVAGVATFAGLSGDTPGTGLELVATAYGAEPETSATFDITPAFQLVFTTQPSASTVAGSAFAQQPVVEIRDMDNVLIDTATDEVTISLAAGDGQLACTLADEDGNQYEGTLTVAAVAGVATFTGLSIDTAGTDKVLAVIADYAEAEESSTFTITAPQTLAFATQPSASTAAGVAFAQQPAVEIKDNTGSRNTSATDEVTLILFSDAGMLTGTATVAAVDGLATFSGLAVDAAGTDNTLLAVCEAAESVESDNFEIT